MPTPVARPFFSVVPDFRSGKDTPRAYLDRCLASLAEFEPVVGAFVHLEIDAAKAVADQSTRRWREGKPLSRIDGMPIGIKDLVETIDMPTQCGSPVYEGHRSGRDGASVIALRQAGAVILGKTVTTEFAAVVPHGTRNPWDPRRTPGGSSSGSAAAVAAGMVPVALGAQVIGSLLRPASYCGVIAFKPSVGAINRGGANDNMSQCVHGPVAASMEDAWIVTREIADRAGGDPGYPGLYGPAEPPAATRPKRIAVLETAGWAVADPKAKAALESAVQRIQAAGVEIVRRADHPGVADVEHVIQRASTASLGIVGWETIWPLNAYRAKDPSKLSAFLLERLAKAEKMTLDDYRALLVERDHARAVHGKLAEYCDAAITLAATGPAPLGLEFTGDTIFNTPASFLGTPAISLPALSVDGLPLGLQTMGYLNQDSALFSISVWLKDLLSKAG